MKKQVTILSGLGVLFIILGIVTNFTMNLKHDKQEVNARMKSINNTYEIFKKIQNLLVTQEIIYTIVFFQNYILIH